MSRHFVSNRDETVPLFSHRWLERLSHVHPATPVVLYAPVIAWFGWQSVRAHGWVGTTGLGVVGLLLWTLVEYVLHRWVFHYEPRSRWGQRLHFLMHGVHHAYPRDSTRLVMPPAVSAPLAVAFYALFAAAAGAWCEGLFAGFVVGYVTYDVMHYATHHLPMPGYLGRKLKAYHLRHHYSGDDRGFGVSSPLWDVVFRTMPRTRPLAAGPSRSARQR